MTFVMLNPSTADATQDDPTIRRCMGFARREGCGGIVVVNLFGLRVTRPIHLFDKSIADDPNGLENRHYASDAIAEGLKSGAPVVVAWGAFRWTKLSEVLQWILSVQQVVELQCLGKTADGSPKHPLYLRSDAALIPWQPVA